jgi:menaquinone-dependent protoporphyrinogen oxidase
MSKILVTYASMAGSTADVARAVGEELAHGGAQVDVLPLVEARNLSGYDAVVVGAPMIMGWHRAARRFLRQHRADWQRIPLAVFVTAMSLTRTGEPGGDARIDGVPVCVDAALPKPPAQPARLTFRERYARLENYLQPIVRAAGPTRPVSVGVFAGRLEYGRLPWWAVVFAMVVIQAPAGDRRNWPAIRAWAAGLPAALRLPASQPG